MTMQKIQVPDIGDFKDIPVIEVLVKAGDVISKEQALLVLESDKATMEVPSDVSGTIVSVDIKIGDKVSFGTPFMTVEVSTDIPAKKEACTCTCTNSGSSGRYLFRYSQLLLPIAGIRFWTRWLQCSFSWC